MKKLLHVILIVFTFSIYAQSDRVEIQGKIIVEGDDIEGISIYNKTASDGTISDAFGGFLINAKVNDTIEVRALQYQNFDVIINKNIIDSKKLNIFLIQQINLLDEIVISNKKVTGELTTDLKSVKTFTPKMDAIYFGAQRETELNESPRDFTRNNQTISNLTNQNKPLVNGLNLINVVDQLLLPLFRSEVKDKEKVGIPEVPAEAIKYYLGSEFLSSNFNIPTHRVEEFIRYVDGEKDFDFTLLNYGRELEFLELLNKKSRQFLNKTKD